MSHSAAQTGRQNSRGRKALGLFVAVWLNLALQPCAMAYEVAGNHDCPDCPPSEMQGHHDMHDGMHDSMPDEMPCAEDLTDCMIDEDVNHDVRGDKLELKDVPPAVVYALASSDCLELSSERGISAPRYASVHPGAPPPLHLLNCVFLD